MLGVFRTVLGLLRTGDVFEKPSRMRKEGAKQLCHLHGFVLIALIAFVRSLTARVIVVIWVMNGDNAECLSVTSPCVVDDDVMTKIMVSTLVHGSIF